jgi:hypothetical protein
MYFPQDGMTRPSSSSVLGKCDDRLDVPLPSQVKEHLAALAIAAGYGSASEYVRELLAQHLYGHVAAMQAAYGRVRPQAMGADIGRKDDR